MLHRRFGGKPFGGGQQMEVGGWIGLAEPRPIDALSLAFFSDALIPAPFMLTGRPAAAPTIDLTSTFAPRSRHLADGARPSCAWSASAAA